mgnify:FL=1
MYEFFKIDDRVLKAAEEAEQKAAPYLAKISETQRYNQEKMQAAFMQAGVSESHFVATTGYGYGDRGRDVLDEVYARALGAEDALCRYNFVSGTHTLTVALFGVLRPGDTMLSVTGMPYDTLRGVIGITGDGNGSLKEFGINYEQLDLLPDGTPDYDGMETAITPKHRMVYIQRSRGYSLRPSLTVEEIERIVNEKKPLAPTTILSPLSRLEKKGFVAVTKEGKNNLYAPLVSEQDYQQKESRSVLERLYGNSLKSFVNSLYQGKHMDQDDIRELSDFLKEMEQDLEEH